jgi:SNF2-related domain/Helicase conserved C-terminal domain
MRIPSLPAALTRTDAAAAALAPTDEEARRELEGMAKKRFGAIPAALVVRHILEVTQGGDFPLRRAALEALQRRQTAATRDALRVVHAPARSAAGLYTIASKASRRPYRTLLASATRPEGSCDCRDFVRNGLGLCKHILVALDHVHRKAPGTRPSSTPATGRLGWDPVRPLLGKDDALARIRWFGPLPPSSRHKVFEAHFAGRGDARPLGNTHPRDDERRRALVGELLQLARETSEPSRERPLPSDPALVPLLTEEAARLDRLLSLAPIGKRLGEGLRGLKHRLFPYQREGVRRAVTTGRLLLADDMGLGKTAQAVATCHALWKLGKVRRGLLIVPASLKPQWLREWESFSDVPVRLVEGSAGERHAFYGAGKGFLISNYEQAVRDLAVMRAWAPDLVVLDEAQRIKNWQTKTAASVKQLEPAFRLVLTGTPLENRLDELASLLDWVDDTALEPKWRLSPWHTLHEDGKREAAGARHLDTLRARLAPSFLRRRKQEVLQQLPVRTDTRVPVELTPQQLEEHDALIPPIAALAARGKRRPLTPPEFQRLMALLTEQRMLCNGLALARYDDFAQGLAREKPTEAVLSTLASPKLAELRDLVRQLAVVQRRRIVVFSQWRRMLSLAHWAVGDLLEAEGMRGVWFSGAESPKRRTQNLVDFHDDPHTRILFATDAGGVGLNLQHAADSCINLELPWNPAVLEQRIARIWRLGQKNRIEVYNLVAEVGIEARIAGLLGDKRALFSGLFDGTSDEVRYDGGGSFLSRVEKLVDLPAAPAAAAAAKGEGARTEDASLDPPLAPTEESEAALAAAAPGAAPAHGAALEPASDATPILMEMLARVQIESTAGGGLRIEAPPEAAATLAGFFAELARRLGGGNQMASSGTAPAPNRRRPATRP